MKWLIAYLAAAAAFALLDFVWMRQAGPALYRPALGEVAAEKVRPLPAIGLMLIYAAAMMWYAVIPGMAMGVPINLLGWETPQVFVGVANAVINGALLGLVVYAVYDLANLATLKAWSGAMAAIDIAWGTAATALASGLGALALKAMG